MNKTCARCEKTVYPIEELKCLDKIWHKGCFKCQECGMTLNMRNYKGYGKLPYCEAHVPKAKPTTMAETPELKRIAENTKIQSNVQYHADFERSKGKFTQVADDPETLRIKANTKIISNVAYHGDLAKKAEMERKRTINENGEVVDNQENYQSQIDTYASEMLNPYQHPKPKPEKQKLDDYPTQPNQTNQSYQPASNQTYAAQPNQTYNQNNASRQGSQYQPQNQYQPNQTNQYANQPNQMQYQSQSYQHNPQYQQANDGNYQQKSQNYQQKIDTYQQKTDNYPQKTDNYQQKTDNYQQKNDSIKSHNYQPNVNLQTYGGQQKDIYQGEAYNTATYSQGYNKQAQTQAPNQKIGKIADYDPLTDGPRNQPFTQRQSATLIYNSSERGANQQQQQQSRRIGSVADMDPMADYGQPGYGQPGYGQPGYGQQAYKAQQYGQPSQKTTQISARVYVAMYDYEANDTDEVSFREGDLISNVTSIDEGWMTGQVLRTGQTGMLPANYVEPAP